MKRVLALEAKGKELKEAGHEEAIVMSMLEDYHDVWFLVSGSTMRNDMKKVHKRLFH